MNTTRTIRRCACALCAGWLAWHAAPARAQMPTQPGPAPPLEEARIAATNAQATAMSPIPLSRGYVLALEVPEDSVVQGTFTVRNQTWHLYRPASVWDRLRGDATAESGVPADNVIRLRSESIRIPKDRSSQRGSELIIRVLAHVRAHMILTLVICVLCLFILRRIRVRARRPHPHARHLPAPSADFGDTRDL